MGSGYAANQAIIISEEKLKVFLSNEYNHLQTVIQECSDRLNFNFESYAREIQFSSEEAIFDQCCGLKNDNELMDELRKKFYDAFDNLCNNFKEETTVFEELGRNDDGTRIELSKLELGLGYHESDNGDIYDDVKGKFWYVDGYYQISPSGQKFQKVLDIEVVGYVTYG